LADDDTGLIYTDEAGISHNLNLHAVVKNLETVTSLSYEDNSLVFKDENGVTTELDLGNLIDEIEADNGLTLNEAGVNPVVELGGTLNKPTEITTSDTNTLAVSGLQSGNTTNVGQTPDQLVVRGSDGVLKTAKSAMPKFFYMPSVLIETVDPGPDGVNLYDIYIEQFTGAGLISSTGAPAQIPHLPAPKDLYYYITYYDSNVFTGLSISEEGVLDFDLVAEPSVTQHSFMNIVFVIKE